MTVAKTNGMAAATATTSSVVIEKDKMVQRSKMGPIREEDDDIKPEDLAPDGGWGWIVALAMILVFIVTTGQGPSVSILLGDFLEFSDQAGVAMTLFNSVFMIGYSTISLFTDILLKRYSMRPVGMVGAVFFSLPNVLLALASDVYDMAFIFFLQGIGLGLIITICNTNFNAYFVKRRTQVMSAAQVIIGISGIVYPIYVEKFLTNYGFRGTAALLGALSLNCIAGMVLMHPVKWHAKDLTQLKAKRIREREEQDLRKIAISNRRSTIDIVHVSAGAKWSSLRSLKEASGKEIPLLIETLKAPVNRVSSTLDCDGDVRTRSRSGSMREFLNKRVSMLSASSLTNLVSGIGALADVRHQHQVEKDSKRTLEDKNNDGENVAVIKASTNYLDLSLLKDRCFLNLCLGISFVLMSDYTFMNLLPLMMNNYGYEKSATALAVTIGAMAELVSRILLALFTLCVNVKARYLFFFAMICMSFAKVGFLFYGHTLMGAFVMNAAIGGVRAWLLVSQPLVIIENIPIDKFASAYGIFAVVNGVISILFGPIAGIIKDWTNSFHMYQLTLLGMHVLFILPWAIQFLLVDRRKNKKERRNASNALQSNLLTLN